MAEFDKGYWEDHWSSATSDSERELPVNPYLVTETAHLHTGTALDAGCGTGSEALWLAQMGWEVTGADISATALATAQARAATRDVNDRIGWIEADLSHWKPERTWDLVATSYAHAQIGQLSFYRRIARWVAPGGTLLIVGHLHGHPHDDHPGHVHSEGATATLAAITNLFAAPEWQVEAGYEHTRTVHPGGSPVQLRDAVVRTRRLV